jgi:hypothetical protein
MRKRFPIARAHAAQLASVTSFWCSAPALSAMQRGSADRLAQEQQTFSCPDPRGATGLMHEPWAAGTAFRCRVSQWRPAAAGFAHVGALGSANASDSVRTMGVVRTDTALGCGTLCTSCRVQVDSTRRVVAVANHLVAGSSSPRDERMQRRRRILNVASEHEARRRCSFAVVPTRALGERLGFGNGDI